MAKIKRRNWTTEEDAKLTELHTSGIRYVEIGKRLNRTPEACEHRRKLLGLPTFTELEAKSYR